MTHHRQPFAMIYIPPEDRAAIAAQAEEVSAVIAEVKEHLTQLGEDFCTEGIKRGMFNEAESSEMRERGSANYILNRMLFSGSSLPDIREEFMHTMTSEVYSMLGPISRSNKHREEPLLEYADTFFHERVEPLLEGRLKPALNTVSEGVGPISDLEHLGVQGVRDYLAGRYIESRLPPAFLQSTSRLDEKSGPVTLFTHAWTRHLGNEIDINRLSQNNMHAHNQTFSNGSVLYVTDLQASTDYRLPSGSDISIPDTFTIAGRRFGFGFVVTPDPDSSFLNITPIYTLAPDVQDAVAKYTSPDNKIGSLWSGLHRISALANHDYVHNTVLDITTADDSLMLELENHRTYSKWREESAKDIEAYSQATHLAVMGQVFADRPRVKPRIITQAEAFVHGVQELHDALAHSGDAVEQENADGIAQYLVGNYMRRLFCVIAPDDPALAPVAEAMNELLPARPVSAQSLVKFFHILENPAELNVMRFLAKGQPPLDTSIPNALRLLHADYSHLDAESIIRVDAIKQLMKADVGAIEALPTLTAWEHLLYDINRFERSPFHVMHHWSARDAAKITLGYADVIDDIIGMDSARLDELMGENNAHKKFTDHRQKSNHGADAYRLPVNLKEINRMINTMLTDLHSAPATEELSTVIAGCDTLSGNLKTARELIRAGRGNAYLPHNFDLAVEGFTRAAQVMDRLLGETKYTPFCNGPLQDLLAPFRDAVARQTHAPGVSRF